MPDFTVVSADAIHDVDEITPVHLPHIWHNCTGGDGGGGGCAVNVTTVTQPVYATLDGLDTGFYYQSASELRVKLKSRQAILLAAGTPASSR